MTPVGDPYEAIVSLGQPTNVDTVIVDGRILRQSGKFTALDHGKVVHEAKEAAAGCVPGQAGRRKLVAENSRSPARKVGRSACHPGHRPDQNPAVQHLLPDRGVLSFRSEPAG
jgi:hypothetical protein